MDAYYCDRQTFRYYLNEALENILHNSIKIALRVTVKCHLLNKSFLFSFYGTVNTYDASKCVNSRIQFLPLTDFLSQSTVNAATAITAL